MQLTVYISSTQRDLKDERDELRVSLRKAGHHVICMEDYPAFTDPPEIKCAKDVKESDIYICLTGARYGDRPIGSILSYTEHEYRAALTSNKEVLVFMKKIVGDSELEAFKARLRKGHGVLEFIGGPDLAKSVHESISYSRSKKNQTIDSTYINPNLKYYCDREAQSIELDAKIRRDQGKPVVFSLEGYTRNMHRSFIARLKNEAGKSGKKEEEALVDVEITLKVEGKNTAPAVCGRILDHISSGLPKTFDAPAVMTFASIKKFLVTHPGKTLLIVIFIHESFVNDNNEKMKKYKEGIAAFTTSALKISVPKENSFLICVCLEETTKNDLPKIVSATRSIKRLPPLGDIVPGDVSSWLYKLEKDGNEIQRMQDMIFRGARELPLSIVEKELDIIIKQYNSKRHED